MGRTGSGIEIRGDSIRVSFTLNGQRQRHTLQINGKPLTPSKANLKYAERLVAEIKEKIRLDIFSVTEYFPAAGAADVLTTGRQLDDWLAAQRIEASTKAGYSSAIKFWKGAGMDCKPLKALRTSDIMKALATRPTLTGKTVNNYVSVLREAIQLAVTDKILSANPAADIKRAKHQKEPPDPFTGEERDKIIGQRTARHPGQVANMVEFWCWTGLRTSEIFALSWPNVDLANGTVLVAEANVRGALKNRTKTNTARTVRLNSRALAALQRQRSHTQITGGLVFHDPRHGTGWVDERAFRRSFWTPVLKVLGIRYRRPYNMRHSYATAMLMAGMTPAFCAKQLGHSVEMFLRTYSKWLDGEQNDMEMARLELAIAPLLPHETNKAPVGA
jgi:integrase